MSQPTPQQYEAMHRSVAVAAAAQVYSSTEVSPNKLLTYASVICTYLDDGTVPEPSGWL